MTDLSDLLRSIVKNRNTKLKIIQKTGLDYVRSSFPVIHKVCNVGIFAMFMFESKWHREINHLIEIFRF